MHNHCLLGRCRMSFLGAALSAGLSFTAGVAGVAGIVGVAGCQGSTTNNDPNYHPVDSRRGMGNPAVGALCDDKHVCAPDSKNQTPACLTAHLYDTVGFCAPACTTDSDCDTYLPGLAKCTNMGSSPQCVLFCDQQHVNTSKACPDMWSCELVQGPQQSFYMCVPPQTKLTTDM